MSTMNMFQQAIWNWMDNYPEEFTELQRRPNDELAGKLQYLFTMFVSYYIISSKSSLLIFFLHFFEYYVK